MVTDKLMHTGLGWISMLIAVIATAQQRVTRLLEPRAEVAFAPVPVR